MRDSQGSRLRLRKYEYSDMKRLFLLRHAKAQPQDGGTGSIGESRSDH